MAEDVWSGLITNASPYALPPGAAVEQVNLTCTARGQLQSRGGMRRLAYLGAEGAVLDCHPCEFDGTPHIIVLREDGSLEALVSPAYGTETATPLEPSLSVLQGQRAFSYTHRYVDGTFGAVTDQPPVPPSAGTYIADIDGGLSATLSWPYYLNAMLLCGGIGKESVFDGGGSTSRYRPDVPLTAMCSTP